MLHVIATRNATTAQVCGSHVFMTVHQPARYANPMNADSSSSETMPGKRIYHSPTRCATTTRTISTIRIRRISSNSRMATSSIR